MFTIVVITIVMITVVVSARLNLVRHEAVCFVRVTYKTRLDLAEADWWSS
jgi:hypothetical protein